MANVLKYLVAFAGLVPDLVGDIDSVKTKFATDKTVQQKVADVLSAAASLLGDIVKELA